MKHFLFFLISTLLLFGSCKKHDKGYTINGKIRNAPELKKIYLKNDHTGIIEDSTSTNNGVFYFKGITPYPQRYSITYKSDNKGQSHFIWVENTKIEIVGKWDDMKNLRVDAGNEQNLFQEVSKKEKVFYSAYNKLRKEKKYDSINFLIDNFDKARKEFFIKNSNSYVSIENLYRLRDKINKDTLELILKGMDETILNSKYGKSLSLHYESPSLEVGSQYKDFTAKTLDGQIVTVSQILKKEKPVLLILGGLGCMQKRGREILKNFHDVYKNDIEILAFVFTQNKKEWFHDSKYPLDITLLSDMKGDHSPVKIQYGVQSTPTVFIINKKGVIHWKSKGYWDEVNNSAKELFNSTIP